jgi:hypothetical protein
MSERQPDKSRPDPPARPEAGESAPVLVRRGSQPAVPDVSDVASGRWFDVRIALGVAVLLVAPAGLFLVLAVQGPSVQGPASEPSSRTPAEAHSPTGVPPSVTPTAAPADDATVSRCGDAAAATAADRGDTDDRIDVDGDGCEDVIAIGEGRIEVTTAAETVAFSLGERRDEILVGDWDCDGTATPALYRARTGTVYEYERWPWESAAVTPSSRRVAVDGVATRVRRGSCDRLEVSAG